MQPTMRAKKAQPSELPDDVAWAYSLECLLGAAQGFPVGYIAPLRRLAYERDALAERGADTAALEQRFTALLDDAFQAQ